MEALLIIPLVLSFFLTFFILPPWIKKAGVIGFKWEDMNKTDRREVAGGGGISVVTGFIFGVLIYIAIQTFYFNSAENIIEIFAMISSILILGFIGLIDDMFGWQHGGLSKKFRVIMCLLASIPLVVINAGTSAISVPFIEGINLGLIYPLVVIPIGITGAATTFNFLAGFNGLEASQGILLIASLAVVNYYTGNIWLVIICLVMVASLLAFWVFNKYPSKVFPGDSLTYSIGGLIAIIAILGNIERITVFFFIPYIFETVLKVRGGLKKQSFGKVNEDGSLGLPYEKIYGLEHLAIYIIKKMKKSGRAYEREVVYLILFFQMGIIVLGFILFNKSIFGI
ncbi:MAG: glycosyl transferase family 4 [archaeon]